MLVLYSSKEAPICISGLVKIRHDYKEREEVLSHVFLNIPFIFSPSWPNVPNFFFLLDLTWFIVPNLKFGTLLLPTRGAIIVLHVDISFGCTQRSLGNWHMALSSQTRREVNYVESLTNNYLCFINSRVSFVGSLLLLSIKEIHCLRSSRRIQLDNICKQS